jgi:hypothetical protein
VLCGRPTREILLKSVYGLGFRVSGFGLRVLTWCRLPLIIIKLILFMANDLGFRIEGMDLAPPLPHHHQVELVAPLFVL